VNLVSAHLPYAVVLPHAVKGHGSTSARTPYRDRFLWNTWSSIKVYRCSCFLQHSPGELD